MIKNLIRGLIVLVSLVSVFVICERVLMLKSEDGIEQMKSFYLQEEDTVDVLLVGSSHIYCNVNTGELWDTYGMSAFNLGGAEQPYWNSYYFIKEALKTQRPKAIVLSVTIPGIRFDEYQSEVWLTTNLYGMHWNKNRIDNNKVSALPESFWRILIPMNTIHGRYTDLKKDDFVDKNYNIAYKGFDYRATIVPFDTPDISGVTEMTPMIEKQEIYLRKIIELTKEENIPLLLVSVPYVVSEDAQKVYNYEFEIARQEGVDFIDFNKCYDEMGLDFRTDMAEELHLNIDGGIKFTRYLGQCLKDRYDIEDHRGDPLYSSWDKDALIHRQEIIEEKLRLIDDINLYLTVLNNENYITYISFENIAADDFDAGVLEKLGNLGMNTTEIEGGYSATLCNKSVLFSSSEEEFTAYIDEGVDKLVYKRDGSEEKHALANVYIDTDCYPLRGYGLNVLVYDRVTDKLVSYISYNPNDNIIARYY